MLKDVNVCRKLLYIHSLQMQKVFKIYKYTLHTFYTLHKSVNTTLKKQVIVSVHITDCNLTHRVFRLSAGI